MPVSSPDRGPDMTAFCQAVVKQHAVMQAEIGFLHSVCSFLASRMVLQAPAENLDHAEARMVGEALSIARACGQGASNAGLADHGMAHVAERFIRVMEAYLNDARASR